MSSKNFFQKIEKAIDDVIFSVSDFAGLGLEAKIEIETGLGLGKISRSRSRTSRSRLQPCSLSCAMCFITFCFAQDKEVILLVSQ